MMGKKISFIISTLSGGGAEKIASTMINYFVNQNEDCSVITLFSENTYPTKNVININHHNFGIKSFSYINGLFVIPYCVVRYYSFTKKYNPHYSYSFLILDNIINILTKQFNNKFEAIISIHTSMSTRFNGNKAILYILKKFYNKADKIVSISQSITNELIHEIKIDENKIFTIPNPVNIFEIERLSMELIVDIEFDKYYKYIIVVSRLNKNKGVHHILNIIEYINKNIKCKLIICGDGELFEKFKKYIEINKLSNVVHLLGWESNPYKYMRRSDLLVSLSDLEALPTILIEGLALGKKIIATDCKEGPREILQNGKNGILIPVLNNEIVILTGEPTEEEILLGDLIIKELSVTDDDYKAAERKKRAQDYDIVSIMDTYSQKIFNKETEGGI